MSDYKAVGDDKWLILGQEMKQSWAGKRGTSSLLQESDVTDHGRSLIWDISCGTLDISCDLVTQVACIS